ncbi:MAG: alpha/beta fold hydrolase [Lachnospiraceae bacterium]|nr:alpha/beta fold hydrolase [Lachnospiraceae bacterium]
MLRKFDKYAGQDAFKGHTREEFECWRKESRATIKELLGWKYMETCSLNPVIEERITLDNGIVREKVIIQVEPDTFMPMYILIPPHESTQKQECFIALPGHQGGGKYSVAGCYDIPAVMKKIEFFNYDYGMQLAKRGYVAVCPDCRGFGERRDEALQRNGDEKAFLTSTCFHLSHMAEALGETVAGMCTWDAARLIDYIYERNEWNLDNLGVVGFSGGGMQAMWLASLDERVRQVIISGYFYGYKDSLLILNGNCNCNYVPHLWEHFDMGDIVSLIAPRPLAIQSCREDHLNGPRGLDNVLEQLETVQAAYRLCEAEEHLLHDVREGGHCWHEEVLDKALPMFGHNITGR